MGRAAAGLVVNTLTARRGEAPHAFLRRNGLDASLLPNRPLTFWPECGVPHANRRGRFNGVTLAFLGLQIPEGKEVPFRPGLAFAPSRGRLPSGAALNQRFIQACDGELEFARPLTAAPPGCPPCR